MGVLQLARAVSSRDGKHRDPYRDMMPNEAADRYSVSGKKHLTPIKKKLIRATSVFVLNIILGVLAGLVYSRLERPGEMQERVKTTQLLQQLRSRLSADDFALAIDAFGGSNETIASDIEAWEADDMDRLTFNWDSSGAMFFAFTVATSIGYGTFAPVTPEGRLFTIIYAIFAIPLMLVAFTSLCSVLLRLLAEKLAGRKRELPIKVFRMMDVDRSGTLSKKECIRAFRIMGLGHYSGPLATMDKRRRLQQSWDKIDPKGRGELVLEQFRQLLVIMLPDEDQALLFVDVITRSYISIVAAGFFLAFCMCSTGMFVYLKRDEGWTVLDSLYFTTMTFLTVGIGDLAPDPYPTSYMIAWVVFTFLGLGFTTTMVQTLTDENLNVLAALRVCCPTLCGVADAKEMSTGELPTKGYQAKRRRRLSNAAAVATANEQLKLGHTSVMDTQARAIEPSGVGSASFNTKLFQIPPGVQTAGATPAAPFAPESVSLANVSSATSCGGAVAPTQDAAGVCPASHATAGGAQGSTEFASTPTDHDEEMTERRLGAPSQVISPSHVPSAVPRTISEGEEEPGSPLQSEMRGEQPQPALNLPSPPVREQPAASARVGYASSLSRASQPAPSASYRAKPPTSVRGANGRCAMSLWEAPTKPSSLSV